RNGSLLAPDPRWHLCCAAGFRDVTPPHSRSGAYMDLTTTYLGLQLPHPFMRGASPLDEDLDMVMRLEDAGAPAIVMHSLFEEDVAVYGDAPDRYLEHLLRIRRRTGLPVIASLNGTTAEGWLQYAGLIEHAGAS